METACASGARHKHKLRWRPVPVTPVVSLCARLTLLPRVVSRSYCVVGAPYGLGIGIR